MDYAIYTVVFKNGKYKDKETKVLANEDILNEYSDRIETTIKYFKNKKKDEIDKVEVENLSDVLSQFNVIEENTNLDENEEEKEYKTKHSYEGRKLKECLSKYIKDLGLNSFNFNNLTDEQIYSISTYGDTLFSIDLKNNGIIDSHKNFLITNETMKYSLYFWGFKEVYSYPTHFAGTLFETLYALSIIQGNFELRSMLFGYLTKEELKMDLINEILKIGEEMNK